MKNKNGVTITDNRYAGHLEVDNAECNCGFNLIIAPKRFNPGFDENDPIVTCTDFGHAAYRFSELKLGKQDV